MTDKSEVFNQERQDYLSKNKHKPEPDKIEITPERKPTSNITKELNKIDRLYMSRSITFWIKRLIFITLIPVIFYVLFIKSTPIITKTIYEEMAERNLNNRFE